MPWDMERLTFSQLKQIEQDARALEQARANGLRG